MIFIDVIIAWLLTHFYISFSANEVLNRISQLSVSLIDFSMLSQLWIFRLDNVIILTLFCHVYLGCSRNSLVICFLSCRESSSVFLSLATKPRNIKQSRSILRLGFTQLRQVFVPKPGRFIERR